MDYVKIAPDTNSMDRVIDGEHFLCWVYGHEEFIQERDECPCMCEDTCHCGYDDIVVEHQSDVKAAVFVDFYERYGPCTMRDTAILDRILFEECESNGRDIAGLGYTQYDRAFVGIWWSLVNKSYDFALEYAKTRIPCLEQLQDTPGAWKFAYCMAYYLENDDLFLRVNAKWDTTDLTNVIPQAPAEIAPDTEVLGIDPISLKRAMESLLPCVRDVPFERAMIVAFRANSSRSLTVWTIAMIYACFDSKFDLGHVPEDTDVLEIIAKFGME